MSVKSKKYTGYFIAHLKNLFLVTTIPAWLLAILWYRFVGNRKNRPWVISGHRGRIKADNSGALFNYILNNTDQPVYWIGIESNTPHDLMRHSWAARMAIARAPVLIYSHGEDDLDFFLKICRSLLGFRVHLGHGLNVLKLDHMDPAITKKLSILNPVRLFASFWRTDYNLRICSSELEKKLLQSRYKLKPHQRIAICGRPYKDSHMQFARKGADKVILWFPTFRNTTEGQRKLRKKVEQLCNSPILSKFLTEQSYTLEIGVHINNNWRDLKFEPQNSNIVFVGTEDLASKLTRTELLISDYSSLILDWLMFDRPAVFFAYDINEFQEERGFYLPYGEYVYGPMVNTIEELIDVIVSKSYLGALGNQDRRAAMKKLFLEDSKNNSSSCFGIIRDFYYEYEHNNWRGK